MVSAEARSSWTKGVCKPLPGLSLSGAFVGLFRSTPKILYIGKVLPPRKKKKGKKKHGSNSFRPAVILLD